MTFNSGIENVETVCALVSDRVKNVHFEENIHHWALSYIDADPPNRTTETLSDILFTKRFTDIGIMSLDIEGEETNVLTDLIRNRIFPHVMIVEANTTDAMQQHRFMLEKYYKLIGGISPNQFFRRNA